MKPKNTEITPVQSLPFEPKRSADEIPYSLPVTWLEFQKAGVPLPFETPRDEFLRHKNRPTMHQLLQRWDGLPEQKLVPEIFSDSTIDFERMKIQFQMLKQADTNFMSDPFFLQLENALDYQRVQARIHEIEDILESGVEVRGEKVGSIVAGFETQENVRALSSQARARYHLVLATLMKLRMALRGQAGEISENRESAASTLTDALDAALRVRGSCDKDGYTMDDLEKMAKNVPLGAGTQAKEVEQPSTGRIIDVTPVSD